MKTKYLILTAFSFILFLSQCKDEEEIAVGPDKELFDEATAATGFSFYKNDTLVVASSQATGHKPFMRVRFNAIAQAALDSTGKLPSGASFPNGSLIVKDLYDSQTGPIALYAIMKKDSTNANAGVNWLWAEIGPDEKVAISVTDKGAICIGCHSTSSRDYTRIFDLF